VTEFIDKSMQSHNLDGPANDVELFKSVLEREPFKLHPTNIRTLAGMPADPNLRPTRANIEREFRSLAAQKGGQVVILMAGHGSQQPANSDPSDNEPDGLDEIFLPADATGWDKTASTVRNAIVDDDIRKWLSDIRTAGASVWMVFDSCQSGTMTRGAPSSVERVRRIDPAALGVPAATAAGSARGSATETNVVGLSESSGEIAALFAAHMSETTPERAWRENGPVHGLFTFTLAEVLAQSRTAMTYRELGQRVMERYRSMPRYAPNPMMEGAGLDREVLGLRTWPDRPQMLLTDKTQNGEWVLNAGAVQGITPGSILEVFPPAGSAEADRSIGHAIVRSEAPTTSRVAPVAFGKAPAPASTALVPGTRARVRVFEPGSLRLKVAVQQPGPRNEYVLAPANAVPAGLQKALTDLPALSAGLAERVSTDAADWYLRVIDGHVILMPASGWQMTSLPAGSALANPPQFDAGRLDDPALATNLATSLRRIGAASNLLRLGALPVSDAQLEFRVIRHASQTSASGRPLFATPRDFAINVGEFVEFRVKNLSQKELDVTLLFVDARYGIQPVFPNADSDLDNQFKRGEERAIGRFQVTGDPVGWESIVAIGVESTMTRRNFRMLAQDGLQMRSTSRGADSALQRLLEAAVGGRTRGPLEPVETFVVKVVSWRTDPAKQR
jgi:hypothetical protein